MQRQQGSDLPLGLSVQLLTAGQGWLGVGLWAPALGGLAIGLELLVGVEPLEEREAVKRTFGMVRVGAAIPVTGRVELPILVGERGVYLRKGSGHAELLRDARLPLSRPFEE